MSSCMTPPAFLTYNADTLKYLIVAYLTSLRRGSIYNSFIKCNPGKKIETWSKWCSWDTFKLGPLWMLANLHTNSSTCSTNNKMNDLKLNTVIVCIFVIIVCLFLFCFKYNSVCESNWSVGRTTRHWLCPREIYQQKTTATTNIQNQMTPAASTQLLTCFSIV